MAVARSSVRRPGGLRVCRTNAGRSPVAPDRLPGDSTTMPTSERRRFRVRGVVQGVGFRPFVYGLARRHELGGFVFNDGEGVLIEAEGVEIDRFAAELVEEAPPLARIASMTTAPVELVGETEFRIVESRKGGRSALIPPDIATCD